MKRANRFVGQSMLGLGVSLARMLRASPSEEVVFVLRENEERSQPCENLREESSRLRDQPVQRP